MGGSSLLDGCIVHGPWGGSFGGEWVYMPDLGFTKSLKISVRYGEVIDSINFQTCFTTGETLSSSFGGKGGNRTDTISIDYPNEYLKSISGTIGNYQGSNVVMSVCFNTNQNCYGPFGTSSGTVFSYDGKGGVIVGFHGHADKYLNAIGVYVMPKSFAFGPNSTYGDKLMPELFSSMCRMTMPRDAGPWGACGGKPWDDGLFSAIKRIHVHEGELNAIYAIQFEYLKKDGESFLSQVHGGKGGCKTQLVNLDHNDEYLTGISGFYGPVKGYNGLEAIASISFHTNKRIHGPYGEDKGFGYSYYSSTTSPGKVAGFHGRDNGFLSAIGVHMEYF
ncbi:putative jacalin-like lectin domain-containing protein [Helianthus annuus]|nr:putative jacalin-like lectin domain-containing protein [Helianthus annuus]